MSAEKIKNALKALREAAPERFKFIICCGGCPTEWGLREECPYIEKDAKVKTCRECWRMALEEA